MKKKCENNPKRRFLTLAPDPGKMAADGEVRWTRTPYRSAHMEGARLAMAATADEALNERMALDARRRAIPVRVVSSAQASDVIFPALLERGVVAVAVHTHGRDPGRSKQARDLVAGLLARTSGGGGHVHR